MSNAATSSIHSLAGSPIRAPHARRNTRMNSRFGSGLGDEMFTTPSISSWPMRKSTARTRSSSCTHDTNCLPDPTVPPAPRRTMPSKRSKVPPGCGLKTIAMRRATLRVSGVDDLKNASSQLLTTSMLKRHVCGAPGSSPPISPPTSSIARSNEWRYTVAVLAFIQRVGGRVAVAIAWASRRVVSVRDSMMRRLFSGV